MSSNDHAHDMSSNDHAHDMSLNDPVHDMSSTDPAADRAAARDRSVARWRNGVSARIALFQDSRSASSRRSELQDSLDGCECEQPNYQVRFLWHITMRKPTTWIANYLRRVMCTLRVSSARGSRRPHAPPKVPPCHHEWMPVRPAFPDCYLLMLLQQLHKL
uniref:Uncharacterized protein n=1 Tax=Triticum urartu TaxID=4572 RepID=A0A8R7QFQ1_TRIUA